MTFIEVYQIERGSQCCQRLGFHQHRTIQDHWKLSAVN